MVGWLAKSWGRPGLRAPGSLFPAAPQQRGTEEGKDALAGGQMVGWALGQISGQGEERRPRRENSAARGAQGTHG